MMTAKLFENGRSQAVRLPKECRFSGDEVSVSNALLCRGRFTPPRHESREIQ